MQAKFQRKIPMAYGGNKPVQDDPLLGCPVPKDCRPFPVFRTYQATEPFVADCRPVANGRPGRPHRGRRCFVDDRIPPAEKKAHGRPPGPRTILPSRTSSRPGTRRHLPHVCLLLPCLHGRLAMSTERINEPPHVNQAQLEPLIID